MKFIKFSAVWCGPCKAMAEKIAAIKKSTDVFDEVDYIEIDVDDDVEYLSEQYSVASIPVIVATADDGTELGRLSGNVPEERIVEFINKYK